MNLNRAAVRIASIAACQTWPLRHRVMWPSKSIDYVKVEEDDHGLHYGLFKDGSSSNRNNDDNPISVVSLFITPPTTTTTRKKMEDDDASDVYDEAQFRKFCTDTSYQGNGYGTLLLKYMFDTIQTEYPNVNRVWCNARKDKTKFYNKRFGMVETDETFVRGDIEYVIMETYMKKSLPKQ